MTQSKTPITPAPRRAWYKRPTAIALLNRIAHGDYTTSEVTGFNRRQERDTWQTFEGEAADALHVIHEAAWEEFFKGSPARGKGEVNSRERDLAIHDEMALGVTVDQAIGAIFGHAKFWESEIPSVLYDLGSHLEAEPPLPPSYYRLKGVGA